MKQRKNVIIALIALAIFVVCLGFFIKDNRLRSLINVSENTKTLSADNHIYELTILHGSKFYANPWEDVKTSVKFTNRTSSQTISIDGFYYDTNTWKVHFRPLTKGKWRWELIFQTPVDTFTESGSFENIYSDNKGFLRQSPANPFRLVFEDGTLFNGIGIGDCIRDGNKNGKLDEWGFDGELRGGYKKAWHVTMPTYMKAYGKYGAGFNLFRWSVDNCAFKLWDNISTKGNRYLIKEGIWGDELVQELQKNGFRVWMVIFGFKPPFPDAVGNQIKEDAIKHYIRYIVARYGAYVDIWELANEVSAVGGPTFEVSDKWLIFASDYLRSIDPYNRMITNSFSRRGEEDYLDIRSPHWYQKESEFESDIITSNKIAWNKKGNKPVVFGEQGNSVQNWDNRSALRMRLRSWTAFFEEGILIFWNSTFAKDYITPAAANIYIGPKERGYIRALQNFTNDIDADVVRFRIPLTGSDIRAYGLKSQNQILGYFHHFTDHTNQVSTTIALNVPNDGTLTWIDPSTGKIINIISVKKGQHKVTTPNFTIDLAFKIRNSQQGK